MTPPANAEFWSVALAPARELAPMLRGTGSNTAYVITGAALLGLAAGLVGAFGVLRRRALLADTVSHAALPGLVAAFLLASALGSNAARSLPVLLLGAAASGLLGLLAVHAITRATRLRDDAAMALVLSVFFGAGVALLSIAQADTSGSQAGLNTFIFGQPAAMHRADALTLAVVAALAVSGVALLRKELALVCVNEEFARGAGWPVWAIDLLLMLLLIVVTVAALPAVGVILVVALMIIPAAAARFWTDRLSLMLALSAAIGAASGYAGAVASALAPSMPAGAVIVLAAGAAFAASAVLAPRRGILAGLIRRAAQRLRIAEDHLLESLHEGRPPVTGPWIARWAAWRGLIEPRSLHAPTLTHAGSARGARISQSHALVEAYLDRVAGVPGSHAEWSADHLEHVLTDEQTRELRRALDTLPPHPEQRT